jgi:tricorn protease
MLKDVSLRKWLMVSAVLCLGWMPGQNAFAANGQVQGYYRFPTIHGKHIVFAAEGDLWRVSTSGGSAQRLTSHAGPEGMPHVSPDGKWIAFSAYYGGDMDVYVIPAAGGVPRRLTFRAGPDLVVGWTNNSKGVMFRSLRDTSKRAWNLYIASLDGKGIPKRFLIGQASSVTFSPNGKRVAFTRFARETRTWKRYLGGWAQDIWVGNLKTKRFKKITRYPGTDAFPMWYKKRIYFLSDRTGERNIYSMKPNGKGILQHTHHKGWDARWPSLGSGHIVYQRGADIWLLNLATNRTRRVPITLPTDAVQRQPRSIYFRRYIRWYDVGPKGKRVLVTARGRVFNIPVKKGIAFQVTRSSAHRSRYASFSHDGKQVVAMTDRTGEQEVVLLDPMGEKSAKVLTKGNKAFRFYPTMSPNGKWIAFADKNLTLWLADAKTGKLTKVARSKVWEIRNYEWSPDSRYLAYVKPVINQVGSIFLYDTKTKKSIQATTTWTDDFSPTWSRDGKRLYFLSRRTINPFFGDFEFMETVNKSTKIYVLELRDKQVHQFAPKDNLVQERNKAEKRARKKAAKAKKKAKKGKKAAPSTKKAKLAKKGKKKAKTAKKAKKGKKKCKKGKKCKKSIKVRVDVKGLLQRVHELPGVPAGHYFGLKALKGKLLVMNRPTIRMLDRRRFRGRSPFSLWSYSFKAKRIKPAVRGVSSYTLSSNRKFIGLYMRGGLRVLSTRRIRVPKGRKGLVNLRGLRGSIKPVQEWRQILLENWRLQRDFYWAPNMAKVDWDGMKKRYLPMIRRILTRGDLNDVIGELIGELGTSHTYVWGGDRRRFRYARHGVLGADVEIDNATNLYRFKKIYKGAPWSQNDISPFAPHHLRVTKGTYILSINGLPLKGSENLFARLQDKAGQLIVLKVNDKPTLQGARRVVVRALSWRGEMQLRYIDWVEGRRKRTLQLSQGKVGYIHLPNMSAAGLIMFYKMWYPQLHKRAMVIDVRTNGGGFVSQLIIQKLMRRVWAFFKPRNSNVSETVPSRTFHGHAATLSNAKAGSDGDIFCKSFQLNKLGPVIGTRTWGGVVGIRADKRSIDGGMTTQPEYAWWSHKKKLGWKLENSGVTPDIYVDNTPNDEVRGRDRQLQVAVKYLLNKLKQDPKRLPKIFPYPNKSIKSFRKRMKRWQAPAAPVRKSNK